LKKIESFVQRESVCGLGCGDFAFSVLGKKHLRNAFINKNAERFFFGGKVHLLKN
jgi:hypothetical protein